MSFCSSRSLGARFRVGIGHHQNLEMTAPVISPAGPRNSVTRFIVEFSSRYSIPAGVIFRPLVSLS